MTEYLGLMLDGTFTGSALFTLVAATALLLAVTFLFSMYAVVLRAGHESRRRTWARLAERWEGPVLAAILEPDKAETVHEYVDPRYRLHFVRYVLDYSRRVKGVEKDVLRSLALPYLEPIAKRADHRRSEIRTRSIETLGALGLPTYADVVLHALDDPSPLVRMVAARALARKEYSEYADAIIARVDRFEGWHRRFLAAMLASIGSVAAPRLRECMSDHERPAWVRATLADALYLQHDPLAADPACAELESSDDRELTLSLLRILSVVGRPEHRDRVRSLCESDDQFVRGAALHALGRVGRSEDIPLLLHYVDAESPWIGLNAARGVLAAGGREELEWLADGEGHVAELVGQVLYEEDNA